MVTSTKKWMTTREAANYLGHCEDHIRDLANLHSATKHLKSPQGIRGYQRVPGGPWRFNIHDLDSFLQSQ